MPRNYSIFLDGIRLSAALLVLFGHLTMASFSGSVLPRIPIEHDGVVIFFLLSGYVIGYCAHERETSARQFAIARIARVFSVAVPALALTIVLDRAGMAFNPALYAYSYEFHKWYLYLPLFLSFTSEIWFQKVSAFSNTPYWSLAYEVWYYILFASIFFLRGRARYLVALAVFLAIGPKIWLLAPLWFSGYLLYRLHRQSRMPPSFALFLALFSAAGYVLVKLANWDGMLNGWTDQVSAGWVSRNLSGSQFFLGDYFKGIFIFGFLYAMRYCPPRWLEADRVARRIRHCAQYTFSLYLFHFPIIVFLAAMPLAIPGAALLALDVILVFALVFTLGGWCERQKDRLRQALNDFGTPVFVEEKAP